MVNLKTIALLSVFFATFVQISTVALSDTKPSRCGNEDGDLVRNKRWTIIHKGYVNKTITYRISDYSRNLTKQDVDDLIQRAFNAWTEHIDLNFVKKQKNESADIDIRFAVREHECFSSFDGRGGTLAHAAKNFAHFDDEEVWKVKNYEEGKSLYRTAVHEFGHCLGLGHSHLKAAIMFGEYVENQQQLHKDDILGIQKIYGDKKKLIPYSEKLCKDPTFDTMFETPDKKTYIFKKDKYYEVDPFEVINGPKPISEKWKGFEVINGPKPISEKWKGLPDSITAAFSENGKTIFFKSGQYWRFSGCKMDPNYPKLFSDLYSKIPDNFKTATVWEDGKIYFFRGSKYWRVDKFNERYAAVTEGLLKNDWKGIPNFIHTAHYAKRFGYTLFFKNDKFYVYSIKDYWPKPRIFPTTKFFFGCNSTE